MKYIHLTDRAFILSAESDEERDNILQFLYPPPDHEPLPPVPDLEPAPPIPWTSRFAFEGFGRATTGGSGQPEYVVKNLNNAGSGSLRDALSQSNRNITFSVGGTIDLASELTLDGKSNITIDGSTAPAPGITLRGHRLGLFGVKNVVLRCFRHRGHTRARLDVVELRNSERVVLDRMSISNAPDGVVDITLGSKNVTMQWCILGPGKPTNNFLNLVHLAQEVTLHHNLYWRADDRTPLYTGDNPTVPPGATVVDSRNNLWWQFLAAVKGRTGARGNFVANYAYSTRSRGVDHVIRNNDGTALMHVRDNVSGNGWNINGANNSSEFPAPALASFTDAITAAYAVRDYAGARTDSWGLDEYDQNAINEITELLPLP